MAEEVQTEVQTDAGNGGEVVESMGGSKSFNMSAEPKDPMRSELEPKPAPAGILEKFWDADKGEVRVADLMKSYNELESKLGAPKEDEVKEGEDASTGDDNAKEGDGGAKEGDGEAKEGEGEAKPAPLADAITSAQSYFAEHGDLPADARKDLHALGISDEVINLQISGAKAYEAGLRDAASKAAGAPYEEVEKAIQWAASNWGEKQINAFNSQSGDMDTIGQAVIGLMASYRAASPPSEGKLTNVNGGTNRGDVYTDRDAFRADLAKADASRDKVARRQIIAKMDRSIKAGSLKN